jgi:hypothetical protein
MGNGPNLVHDASLPHGVDDRSMFCADTSQSIQAPTEELTKDAALITNSCVRSRKAGKGVPQTRLPPRVFGRAQNGRAKPAISSSADRAESLTHRRAPAR